MTVNTRVIGYYSCRSGLNNQKTCLLGLVKHAIDTGSRITMPRIVDFATDGRGAIKDLAIGDLFNEQSIRAAIKSVGVDVQDGESRNNVDYNKMFSIGSHVIRGTDSADRDLSIAIWRTFEPAHHVEKQIRLVVHDLFEQTTVDGVLQLRIEPDWKEYEATYMKIVEGEDRTTSYKEILTKVRTTFKEDVQRLYITCDELVVPRDEITEFAASSLNLNLIWKSGLRLSHIPDDAFAVRTTVDFEIASRAPIFIGSSRSTFANMACLARSAREGTIPKHFIYNAPGPELRPRSDYGRNVDYREV